MDNKDQYFQHDYRARNDLKIKALLKKHGAPAYAVFWSIVEELHQNENKFELKPWFVDGIASDLFLEPDTVKDIIETCIEYELFFKEENTIMCKRVEQNLQKRQQVRENKSKAGKASALARNDSTGVEQVLTGVEHDPTKEKKVNIKGNENKENENEPPSLEFSFPVFRDKYPHAKDGNQPGMTRAQKVYSQSINGQRTEVFKALENYAKSEQVEKGIVMSAEKFLLTDWRDWLDIKSNGNGAADDDDEIVL